MNPEDYPDIHKMAILADVAPYSREYNTFRQIVGTRWARKGYLPAHPMGEGKKKYWRFFEHELLTWLLGQSDVVVAA